MDAGAPSRHPGFIQQQDVVSNLFGSAHWIVSPRSTNARDSSSWPIPTSPRDICSESCPEQEALHLSFPRTKDAMCFRRRCVASPKLTPRLSHSPACLFCSLSPSLSTLPSSETHLEGDFWKTSWSFPSPHPPTFPTSLGQNSWALPALPPPPVLADFEIFKHE